MTAYRIVIPARYASTRLPGKPLLPIAGRPMIQHVHERAWQAGAVDVVVATDDARIRAACEGFGATVCMTRPDHPSGTDRIAEVIERLGWPDETIVVNLQGDEPLMPASLLEQVAGDLEANPDAAVATLGTPIDAPGQVHDENVVKVVRDAAGFALYFSRAAIPWRRGVFSRPVVEADAAAGLLRHIGLYAYRAGAVREFVGWEPAPIETAESLEQLRFLWNGRRIHVSVAGTPPPPGVDTAEDLERMNEGLGPRA